MLHKPRYIHSQHRSGSRYRGFTAYIEQSYVELYDPVSNTTELVYNPTHCFFRIAYCSRNDHFSRKAGREAAFSKQAEEIKVTDLPKRLAQAALACYDSRYQLNQDDCNAWAWIWKYFL